MTKPIIIEAVPHGKMETRYFARHGRIMPYKHKKQQIQEELLRQALEEYLPGVPYNEPLGVEVMAYRPIPKSWSKRDRELAERGLLFPAVKPDADNYQKHLFDCMTQVTRKVRGREIVLPGFWLDDKLICDVNFKKRYSTEPRWVVRVTPLVEGGAE